MVTAHANGNRIAAYCQGVPLPPVEILPGGIVRRQFIDGVWPYAMGDIRRGRCMRKVTLSSPEGGQMEFTVWLELEADGFVYAHCRGCEWLSHDDRAKEFVVPKKLATHAEWLAIQMV